MVSAHGVKNWPGLASTIMYIYIHLHIFLYIYYIYSIIKKNFCIEVDPQRAFLVNFCRKKFGHPCHTRLNSLKYVSFKLMFNLNPRSLL